MIRLRPYLVILALALLAFTPLRPATAGELKAGVGRVVITPKFSMWMAGYASRTAPAEGKVHDLYAKALAIEDESGARLVVVTTDLLGLPRSLSTRIADLARERFGLARERLMLTSSHTHCGPVLRDNLDDMYALTPEHAKLVADYSAELPDLVLRAVDDAIKNIEPCDLAWGVGQAGFGVNRRQYTLGGVQIGVNPIGPVDHDVPVLRVARKDGSVKAALVGYACHNTTLSFLQYCGDYAGFMQARLEKDLPGATVMFAAGCAGDANPNPRGTVELAQKHGEELAAAALAVLKTPMGAVHGPVVAGYKEIPLALTPPPTREEVIKQTGDASVYVQRRAKSLLKRLDEKGSIDATYPYPVQVWRFADTLQWTALGGEVVVDYSLRLKYELGRERQFVIGYANDVMAYIPSLRVLREGGYEGGDSMVYYGLHGPWAPQVEESIVAAVHELSGR